MIREYELKMQTAHKALAVLHAETNNLASDLENMIAELMVKHGIEGTVAEWKPG